MYFIIAILPLLLTFLVVVTLFMHFIVVLLLLSILLPKFLVAVYLCTSSPSTYSPLETEGREILHGDAEGRKVLGSSDPEDHRVQAVTREGINSHVI